MVLHTAAVDGWLPGPGGRRIKRQRRAGDRDAGSITDNLLRLPGRGHSLSRSDRRKATLHVLTIDERGDPQQGTHGSRRCSSPLVLRVPRYFVIATPKDLDREDSVVWVVRASCRSSGRLTQLPQLRSTRYIHLSRCVPRDIDAGYFSRTLATLRRQHPR